MKPIRVLLVDDHVLFRRGLVSLIRHRDGMEVAEEAGNGQEALERARETMPDVILMDVHMPVCDGLEAVRTITSEMPQVKVIMLTVSASDDTLFEAIKSGAQGYLLKDIEPQQLFAMIEAVHKGEVALPPLMVTRVLREFQRPQDQADASWQSPESLTTRELEVLQEVATGASNREIADRLNITEHTVKLHMRNVLGKLHAQNRVQAVVVAMLQGLVNPDPRSS